MKTRKIFAVVLALAMLASLMVMPASAEATTYYSVTGFAVPEFLKNFYDSNETVIGDAINGSIAATHFVTDTAGNLPDHENVGPGSRESVVDGSNVGTNGIQLGVQLAWDATRMVIVDLKKVQPVDKVDIYSGQEGTGSGANSGSISSMKIYTKANEADEWNYVMDITPGTGDGYVADNGWNRWFFQEGTFAQTVNARYIAVEVAHSKNVLVNHINVLSKTDPTPDKELTTYYSVTGYDVPEVIRGAYDSETVEIAKVNEIINYTTNDAHATYYWIDDNGATDIYENNTAYSGKVLNGGLAGVAAGELISWDNTRSIVIDLGKIQPVDKVDLQTAQNPGPNHNGTITSMKVYAKVNESDDWTYVRDITPGVESFLSNGNYTWFYQEGTLATTVNARYIRIRIAHSMNVSVNYVAVLSKTAPTYTPSWGNDLTMLTDNEPTGSFYANEEGLTITRMTTGAIYKSSSKLNVAGTHTCEPEPGEWTDPVVVGASYNDVPVLQNGEGGDGVTSAGTTWDTHSTTITWDLKESFDLERLDVVTKNKSATDVGDAEYATVKVGDSLDNMITVYDGNVVYANDPTGNTVSSNNTAVFDLKGIRGRYVEVYLQDTDYHYVIISEMYIYGNQISQTTGLMFTADGTNELTEYVPGSAIKAEVTFDADGGELVVAWYDGTTNALKDVFRIGGTGEKDIDLSENSFGTGDKLKAFAFNSISAIKPLLSPVEIEVASGE